MSDSSVPDTGQARHCTRPLALRMADEYQEVLDELPEGIAIVDTDNHVVATNAAADTLSDATRCAHAAATAVASTQEAAPNPDEAGVLRVLRESSLQRALHGEPVYGEEVHITNATGHDQVLLANTTPLHDSSGSIDGAVTMFQDISHLRDQEYARMADACHDLQNLLTGILGTSQLLEVRLATNQVDSRDLMLGGLKTIISAAQRLSQQIHVMMDSAGQRADTPADLQRASVDLVSLVQEVVRHYHGATEQHVIFVDGAVDELHGMVDAALLRAVLLNLLSNAIKYSPQGGTIRVHVESISQADQVWAQIRVADSGIGIPPADLPRVFARSFRARNVGSQIPGTGLGLTSVRQIVEQHGGDVHIESTEGMGTTVTIRVPLTVAGVA